MRERNPKRRGHKVAVRKAATTRQRVPSRKSPQPSKKARKPGRNELKGLLITTRGTVDEARIFAYEFLRALQGFGPERAAVAANIIADALDSEAEERAVNLSLEAKLASLFLHTLWAIWVASFLAEWSRVTTVRPKAEDFLICFVFLTAAFTRLDRLDRQGLIEEWPKTPGTTFGPVAGDSALAVGIKFSRLMFESMALKKLRDELAIGFSHGKTVVNNRRPAQKWCVATLKRVRDQLPPLPAWDRWEIERDRDALVSKLEAEYRQVVSQPPKGDAPASGLADPESPALDKNAVAVLCCLNRHSPALLTQYDLEATALSRNTIREALQYLRSTGLAHQPQGERKGYTVTDAGRRVAQSLSAAHH